MKRGRAERFTVKQMEKTRKSLEVRLSKLNDDSRKDDVVTFEQLGVDRLFVDESHAFKDVCCRGCFGDVSQRSLLQHTQPACLRYIQRIADGRLVKSGNRKIAKVVI